MCETQCVWRTIQLQKSLGKHWPVSIPISRLEFVFSPSLCLSGKCLCLFQSLSAVCPLDSLFALSLSLLPPLSSFSAQEEACKGCAFLPSCLPAPFPPQVFSPPYSRQIKCAQLLPAETGLNCTPVAMAIPDDLRGWNDALQISRAGLAAVLLDGELALSTSVAGRRNWGLATSGLLISCHFFPPLPRLGHSLTHCQSRVQ